MNKHFLCAALVFALFGAGCEAKPTVATSSQDAKATPSQMQEASPESSAEQVAFLARRADQIRELMFTKPSDAVYMQQAAVLLSTPYGYAIEEGRWKDLQQATVDTIYVCVDADIFTNPKIQRKIPSKNGKGAIYLFSDGVDQGRTIVFFVVKDGRVTKTARLFVACKGSPSLKSVRWVDNETIELMTLFMSDTPEREVLKVE